MSDPNQAPYDPYQQQPSQGTDPYYGGYPPTQLQYNTPAMAPRRPVSPIVLGIIGIIYAALLAVGQNDLKRLVSYTSIAHFGFIGVGIFAFTTQAGTGAVLYMLNHGLATGLLFLVVGMFIARRGSALISDFGGATQDFASGAKGNLNATLKNNNASHAIGGGTTFPADPRASEAVAFAKARLGATDWNRQCELFVERAFGTSGRFATATAHYRWQRDNGRIHTGSVPPLADTLMRAP